MLKPKHASTFRRSTVTDSKLNTVLTGVKGQGCPSWCESDHSDEENPCWGPDAVLTLTRMACEPGPGQDKYDTLHSYLERKPDGTVDVVVACEGGGVLVLTSKEARRHMAALSHLVHLAEQV
jgi:hypothetical protein